MANELAHFELNSLLADIRDGEWTGEDALDIEQNGKYLDVLTAFGGPAVAVQLVLDSTDDWVDASPRGGRLETTRQGETQILAISETDAQTIFNAL